MLRWINTYTICMQSQKLYEHTDSYTVFSFSFFGISRSPMDQGNTTQLSQGAFCSVDQTNNGVLTSIFAFLGTQIRHSLTGLYQAVNDRYFLDSNSSGYGFWARDDLNFTYIHFSLRYRHIPVSMFVVYEFLRTTLHYCTLCSFCESKTPFPRRGTTVVLLRSMYRMRLSSACATPAYHNFSIGKTAKSVIEYQVESRVIRPARRYYQNTPNMYEILVGLHTFRNPFPMFTNMFAKWNSSSSIQK